MQMPQISSNIESISYEVEQLKKTMDDLGNIEELKGIVARAYECMKESDRAFQEYLKKVNEAFLELSKECRTAIRNGSTDGIVDDLIDKMKENIVASEQKYDTFSKCNAAFVTSCKVAAEECQRLAEEQKSKQLKTRLAGGAVTAAVAAGGTAASVLVGVFTFGLGFAVAFPLTVAATGATASAAGITTAVVAHYFGKGVELCNEASDKAGRLQKHTSLVQENLKTCQSFNHGRPDNDNDRLIKSIRNLADQSDKLCDKLSVELKSKNFNADFEAVLPKNVN